MDWAHILAYVTGVVDQELLARIEYLAAENRILPSEPRWASSVIVWGARLSPKWRLWPDLTPSWPGTASRWPANSMARRPAEVLAGLGSAERSSS